MPIWGLVCSLLSELLVLLDVKLVFGAIKAQWPQVGQSVMDRTVPLFAGYMFVELDAAQNSWRKVNSTLGVARIVSLGGTPTPVPYSIMNQLISRCDRDGILRPSQGVVVGQDVQVLRGPFSNFVAKVEEIETDRRVWVLLDMLGQSSRISVSADAVAHVG